MKNFNGDRGTLNLIDWLFTSAFGISDHISWYSFDERFLCLVEFFFCLSLIRIWDISVLFMGKENRFIFFYLRLTPSACSRELIANSLYTQHQYNDEEKERERKKRRCICWSLLLFVCRMTLNLDSGQDSALRNFLSASAFFFSLLLLLRFEHSIIISFSFYWCFWFSWCFHCISARTRD